MDQLIVANFVKSPVPPNCPAYSRQSPLVIPSMVYCDHGIVYIQTISYNIPNLYYIKYLTGSKVNVLKQTDTPKLY